MGTRNGVRGQRLPLWCIYQALLLWLQLIEPGVRGGGEIIAIIPVRVSARAAFSRYSIHPASLLSFGAMVSGTSRTCSFVLQNKGILSFSFLIQRAAQDSPLLPGTR